MARSSASKAVKPAVSTQLATIDAELSNEVASIKDAIGQPTGTRIKVEPAGNFLLPDGNNLGPEIQIVVLDFVTRNTFYSQPFDRNNPAPPDCYAIGKVLADMKPENDSPSPQHSDCRTCPLNQFGSGDNGKSKACKNARLLAVLLIDPENPDAHNAPDAPVYLMEVSPTSIKSFDGAVAGIARSLGGPPIKAILTVTARNVGTYAALSFVDPMPNPDYAAHAARRPETADLLFRKPDFTPRESRAPARGRNAAPARRVAGARR